MLWIKGPNVNMSLPSVDNTLTKSKVPGVKRYLWGKLQLKGKPIVATGLPAL